MITEMQIHENMMIILIASDYHKLAREKLSRRRRKRRKEKEEKERKRESPRFFCFWLSNL